MVSKATRTPAPLNTVADGLMTPLPGTPPPLPLSPVGADEIEVFGPAASVLQISRWVVVMYSVLSVSVVRQVVSDPIVKVSTTGHLLTTVITLNILITNHVRDNRVVIVRTGGGGHGAVG